MKPSKRTAKKRPRNTACKVLSSGEVTKGNIHPDDVEETMLAVCDGVLKLVRLAFGNTSEIIRHKAGGALVDILKRWFLAEWNTQSDNSHLNVNLLELMKRNDGFKKRHGELYPRTGKKDALGSAVRRRAWRPVSHCWGRHYPKRSTAKQFSPNLCHCSTNGRCR